MTSLCHLLSESVSCSVMVCAGLSTWTHLLGPHQLLSKTPVGVARRISRLNLVVVSFSCRLRHAGSLLHFLKVPNNSRAPQLRKQMQANGGCAPVRSSPRIVNSDWYVWALQARQLVKLLRTRKKFRMVSRFPLQPVRNGVRYS